MCGVYKLTVLLVIMAVQVVYSAGTTPIHSPRSSPLPSPRSPKLSPRGYVGWQPVSPGYKLTTSPSVVIQRTVEVQHVTEGDTNLRDSIPAMSKPLAVVLCVANVLCPGLGTFLCGLSVLCCTRVRPGGGDKLNVVWVNTWVALLQFLTAFLFLLGWIWSVMWGAAFVSIAKKSEGLTDQDGSTSSEGQPDPTSSAGQGRTEGSSASHRLTRTTTTTRVSMEGSADRETEQAPIIVLQEAPVIIQPELAAQDTPTRHSRTLNPYNPRHQRILRRQNTDDDLPGLLMNPRNLEQIVIHNAPVPQGTLSEPATPVKSGTLRSTPQALPPSNLTHTSHVNNTT